MAATTISHANLINSYEVCLAECRQYKHQVRHLEGEAQQWLSHCLIVEAASRRAVNQLEKANADLARELAQARDGQQQMQDHVAALKKELKHKDNEAAQAKILSLKAEKAKHLADLQAYSCKYQKAFSDLATEVAQAKDDKQQLKGDIATLYMELRVKDSAEKAAQAKILSLQAENVQLQEHLKAQRSEIAAYQKDTGKQLGVNAELTRLVTQLQQESEEDPYALEVLATVKAQNSKLEAENSRLSAENSRLAAENSMLKTDNLHRLLNLESQKAKVVEYQQLIDAQKAELAARQAEVDDLAFTKAELRRMRARVLNLHKQKEEWKAEQKHAHNLNQQLWNKATQLGSQVQELLEKARSMEEHTAAVDAANRQLQSQNLLLKTDLEAHKAKVAEFGKAACTQKSINVELTRLVTELQEKIQQQENELVELAILEIDRHVLTEKVSKLETQHKLCKAQQQQLHSSNQQLQEVVAQLERQLQINTTSMAQHKLAADDTVAAEQAALQPVDVGSSNAGRPSQPGEPSTPELGDVSCSSS